MKYYFFFLFSLTFLLVACKTTLQNNLYTCQYVGEVTLSWQISNYNDSVQPITCNCFLNIIRKDSIIKYDLQHSKCKGKPDKTMQGILSDPNFMRQQFEAVLDPKQQEIVRKDTNVESAYLVISDTKRLNFILGALSPNYRFRGNKFYFLEEIFEPTKVLTAVDSTTYNISYQGDKSLYLFTEISGKIVMQNPNRFWADSLHLNINRIHITSVFTGFYKREYQLHRVKKRNRIW
ncbi:MAG: hypothetical protein J0L99_03655 [Chitinophagales bacterium]|nr:hypothetical protein [Chitinophagales bacterium]